MGQILFTREEADEWAAFVRDMIANGAAQNWKTHLERVEDRALGHGLAHVERDLTTDIRESPQMNRQYDSDAHGGTEYLQQETEAAKAGREASP